MRPVLRLVLPAAFFVLFPRTARAGIIAAYFLHSLQTSSVRQQIACGDGRPGVRPVWIIFMPFGALFLSSPDFFGAIEVEQARFQIVEEARASLPDHSRKFLEVAIDFLADHSAFVRGAHGLQATFFSGLLVERDRVAGNEGEKGSVVFLRV